MIYTRGEMHIRTSVTISITDSGFNPPALTIVPGTTVVWRNEKTARSATVTAIIGSDGQWDSGSFPPGGSYARVFSNTGVTTYQDRGELPPNVGTITVSQVQVPIPPSPIPPSSGGKTWDVIIDTTGLDHPVVNINPGDIVRWGTRVSNAAINGINPSESYGSAPFNPGETFSHRFNNIGIFSYTAYGPPVPVLGTVNVTNVPSVPLPGIGVGIPTAPNCPGTIDELVPGTRNTYYGPGRFNVAVRVGSLLDLLPRTQLSTIPLTSTTTMAFQWLARTDSVMRGGVASISVVQAGTCFTDSAVRQLLQTYKDQLGILLAERDVFTRALSCDMTEENYPVLWFDSINAKSITQPASTRNILIFSISRPLSEDIYPGRLRAVSTLGPDIVPSMCNTHTGADYDSCVLAQHNHTNWVFGPAAGVGCRGVSCSPDARWAGGGFWLPRLDIASFWGDFDDSSVGKVTYLSTLDYAVKHHYPVVYMDATHDLDPDSPEALPYRWALHNAYRQGVLVVEPSGNKAGFRYGSTYSLFQEKIALGATSASAVGDDDSRTDTGFPGLVAAPAYTYALANTNPPQFRPVLLTTTTTTSGPVCEAFHSYSFIGTSFAGPQAAVLASMLGDEHSPQSRLYWMLMGSSRPNGRTSSAQLSQYGTINVGNTLSRAYQNAVNPDYAEIRVDNINKTTTGVQIQVRVTIAGQPAPFAWVLGTVAFNTYQCNDPRHATRFVTAQADANGVATLQADYVTNSDSQSAFAYCIVSNYGVHRGLRYSQYVNGSGPCTVGTMMNAVCELTPP